MIKYLLTVLFLSVGVSGEVLGQVSVGPQFVFTDDQNPYGSLILVNNSNSVQEVDLHFRFGYPKTDASGNTIMEYDDSAAELNYSAADWITAYPRVFSLAPGERQTVRLVVRPPSGHPDGRYWGRIVTGAKAVSPAREADFSARLNVRYEQITAFFYDSGEVEADVVFHGLTAETSGDTLHIKAPVSRKGNAPFLGSMRVDIIDALGEIVSSEATRTTVYIDALRVFNKDISRLPSGEYTARVTFIPKRTDIIDRYLADFNTASKSTAFRIK